MRNKERYEPEQLSEAFLFSIFFHGLLGFLILLSTYFLPYQKHKHERALIEFEIQEAKATIVNSQPMVTQPVAEMQIAKTDESLAERKITLRPEEKFELLARQKNMQKEIDSSPVTNSFPERFHSDQRPVKAAADVMAMNEGFPSTALNKTGHSAAPHSGVNRISRTVPNGLTAALGFGNQAAEMNPRHMAARLMANASGSDQRLCQPERAAAFSRTKCPAMTISYSFDFFGSVYSCTGPFPESDSGSLCMWGGRSEVKVEYLNERNNVSPTCKDRSSGGRCLCTLTADCIDGRWTNLSYHW